MLIEFTEKRKGLNDTLLKQEAKTKAIHQLPLGADQAHRPVDNPKSFGQAPGRQSAGAPKTVKDLVCGPRLRSLPLKRPNLSQLSRPGAALPRFVRESRLAMRYLKLLGPLDWDNFPERDPNRPWPGPKPVPRACYVAAFIIKIDKSLRYMSDLREFLVDEPALLWLLGFPLTPSAAYSWGFDAEASLATARHFGRVLRHLDNDALQFLLDSTVTLLMQELPQDLSFAEVIALDTKHIIAWVKENNHKTFIEDRYDKTKQPSADPDCRLGCKRRRNRSPQDDDVQASAADSQSLPTPTTDSVPAKNARVGEFYWGYGSGIIATKVPDWGEFVLAEFTQPFDCSDVSYFFPLMADTERRLGFRPLYGTFDAAFDAFYVYQYFHDVGGIAAVPFAQRGGFTRQFDEMGLPLCQAELPMPLRSTFIRRTSLVEHECGRYACPLLHPEPTGESCPIEHQNWAKGGCVTTMATCQGARIRYQLDRDSTRYEEIYNQRSATERINALATELGIERPKLRNGRSIANRNTLIYVLLNLRALQRVQAKKQIQVA